MKNDKIDLGESMKNKKGFSLIELLAVLIVLGLITVIIVPTVISLLDKGNKDSFKSSVQGLISAVTNYDVSSDEADARLRSGANVTELIEDGSLDANHTEKYISGTVYASSNGTITVADVTDGTYCASGTRNNLTITNYDKKTGKCK